MSNECKTTIWCLLAIKDDAIVFEPKSDSIISVAVVNKYDHNEGIAFKLTNGNVDTSEVYSECISQSLASVSNGKKISISKGRYRITAEPLPPDGESIGPKKLDNYFVREMVIDGASSQNVIFEITRKQSILHNIPMKFHVKPNSSAKSKEPVYELSSMSQVAENKTIIENVAKEKEVDSDLIKAVMYMETTHGYYDTIYAVFDKNSSVLPMNVRTDYWSELGWTRAQLKEPSNNIEAGALLLKRICVRAEPATIEVIATLYQDLGAEKVTTYGARVNLIYQKKLWIPTPSMLEQIEEQWIRFENADPIQQVEMLRRMFGG